MVLFSWLFYDYVVIEYDFVAGTENKWFVLPVSWLVYLRIMPERL